jgi:hypothetical protein
MCCQRRLRPDSKIKESFSYSAFTSSLAGVAYPPGCSFITNLSKEERQIAPLSSMSIGSEQPQREPTAILPTIRLGRPGREYPSLYGAPNVWFEYRAPDHSASAILVIKVRC